MLYFMLTCRDGASVAPHCLNAKRKKNLQLLLEKSKEKTSWKCLGSTLKLYVITRTNCEDIPHFVRNAHAYSYVNISFTP